MWLPGREAARRPTFWESFTGAFGAKHDLRSGQHEHGMHALGLIEAVGTLLAGVGVRDAVTVLLDERVVWRDDSANPDDVGWLLQAMRGKPEPFMKPFREVRAVFEHREQGVHTVIEATFQARFQPGTAAGVIALGGRIEELRPLPGETFAQTRARVSALGADPYRAEPHQHVFRAVLGRIRDGLPYALPGARAVQSMARDAAAQRGATLRTDRTFRAPPYPSPYYDPWDVYYRDPYSDWVDRILLDAALHAAAHGHHQHHATDGAWEMPVHVLRTDGALAGEFDDVGSMPDKFAGLGALAGHDFGVPADKPIDLAEYGSVYASDPAWSSTSDWNSADCSDCVTKTDCSDGASSDCAKDGGWSSDCSSDCMSKSDCGDCSSSDCSKDDCSSDCSSSSD